MYDGFITPITIPQKLSSDRLLFERNNYLEFFEAQASKLMKKELKAAKIKLLLFQNIGELTLIYQERVLNFGSESLLSNFVKLLNLCLPCQFFPKISEMSGKALKNYENPNVARKSTCILEFYFYRCKLKPFPFYTQFEVNIIQKNLITNKGLNLYNNFLQQYRLSFGSAINFYSFYQKTKSIGTQNIVNVQNFQKPIDSTFLFFYLITTN